jgi:8-oxo-dGTP pyrophosphatase MutT (NUDIX family)
VITWVEEAKKRGIEIVPVSALASDPERAKAFPADTWATARKAGRSETLPYRPCVGMMVLNAQGLVWVGHRIAENPIANGRSSRSCGRCRRAASTRARSRWPAARREIYEETGMRSLSLADRRGAEWIDYDLPRERIGVVWKGKYRGQTQKWFAFRFTATKARSPSIRRPAATRRSSTAGLEADGRAAGADRAVQAPGLRRSRRAIPASRNVMIFHLAQRGQRAHIVAVFNK